MGMHKYHSFMEYVQLYPEYDFIFLGDNGQGDAMCADRVIEKAGELHLCDDAYQSQQVVVLHLRRRILARLASFSFVTMHISHST